MKLSQMTSDQAADVMIQIAPDIETLVNDAELGNMIKKRELTSDKNKAKKLGGMFVLRVATYLLKTHREIVWNVLGAMQQKTAEEVASQLFPATFTQVIEVLNDKDFMSFFQLSGLPVQETSSDTSPKQGQ